MEKELSSCKKSLSTLVIKARSKEQSINQLKNNIRKVEREAEIIRQEATVASKVPPHPYRHTKGPIKTWLVKESDGIYSSGRIR